MNPMTAAILVGSDVGSAELDARIDVFSRTVPDYQEVLERAAEIPLPPHVVLYLTASVAGPRLAYHLGKHLDYLEWIVGLARAEALEALAQLEFNLRESDLWLSTFLADLDRQRLATWLPTHLPN